MIITESIAKRFLAKFKPGKKNECWEWMASKHHQGYGHLKIDGFCRRAHIISYWWYKGRVPDGMFVLHSCDNPSCVNPNHLHLGTQADNMQETHDRNRYPDRKGSNHPNAKLTDADVLQIRASYPVKSLRKLAAEFGVSHVLIKQIVKRRSWSHI